jgi:hypothetical protein
LVQIWSPSITAIDTLGECHNSRVSLTRRSNFSLSGLIGMVKLKEFQSLKLVIDAGRECVWGGDVG